MPFAPPLIKDSETPAWLGLILVNNGSTSNHWSETPLVLGLIYSPQHSWHFADAMSLLTYDYWHVPADMALNILHLICDSAHFHLEWLLSWRVTLSLSLIMCYLWLVTFELSILMYCSCSISLDINHSNHVPLYVSLLKCHSWNITLDVSLLTCHSWHVTIDVSHKISVNFYVELLIPNWTSNIQWVHNFLFTY